MKVKTLVAHENEYGVRAGLHEYQKPVGIVYDIDDDDAAQRLIDAKVVAKVGGSDSDAKPSPEVKA